MMSCPTRASNMEAELNKISKMTERGKTKIARDAASSRHGGRDALTHSDGLNGVQDDY
jgi:hypothetical protein